MGGGDCSCEFEERQTWKEVSEGTSDDGFCSESGWIEGNASMTAGSHLTEAGSVKCGIGIGEKDVVGMRWLILVVAECVE